MADAPRAVVDPRRKASAMVALVSSSTGGSDSGSGDRGDRSGGGGWCELELAAPRWGWLL